jgi:hypothetical protein
MVRRLPGSARSLHVEDYGGGAVAVVVGQEVGRFRLEVSEYAIDGGTESAGFDMGVPVSTGMDTRSNMSMGLSPP